MSAVQEISDPVRFDRVMELCLDIAYREIRIVELVHIVLAGSQGFNELGISQHGRFLFYGLEHGYHIMLMFFMIPDMAGHLVDGGS